MNTIYIASRFLTQNITGVQRYAIELSKAIKNVNTKYNIKWISPDNILYPDIAKDLNVIKIGMLKGQLWDQISLFNFLNRNKNPLLVNFSNTSPIFYNNSIVTIHDIIHLKYPSSYSYSYRKYYEIIFPLMIKNARHIITVSEFSKKEIASYFKINEENISIVYNAVNPMFKPIKKDINENYILGVSSIAYHKNFINLIKAFLLLKTKNYKLYIVGGLNKKIFGKKSDELINLLRNNNNIIFLGRINDFDLIQLYSNASCFVYPSLYEGFGIPPLEAQACGCPVVLSDIPVFKEVYGDSAVYFNPLNPEDIAKKIDMLLNDNEIQNYYIQKGFENKNKYSWNNSAYSFLKILDRFAE